MPSFVVYELAEPGIERPYAFVPEAHDASDALARLRLHGKAFIAKDSRRADTGDALCAQYRMRVRAVASRPSRRA